MSPYRSRVVDKEIRAALKTFGAVVIEGPRAVGKTTTGLQTAASSVRLDAGPDVLALAETAPNIVLAGDVPRLIDEWQLAPTLWNAVRHEVDTRGRPGQFLLTGSAIPADDVTRHSGAGRFKRIVMRPMALSESGESTEQVAFSRLFDGEPIAGLGGPSVEDYAALIVRGGWPAVVGQPNRSASDYLREYLGDIARTEIAASGVNIDPVRVRALLRAIARNVSTEAPATRLAAEAELFDATSVSPQTVRKYLDALSRVWVLEELPAWAPHLRSSIRLRVSPVWHFVDPSLAASALNATAQSLLEDPKTLGLLFESLVVRDLRVHADVLGGTVSHYRDEQGLEVDAVIELLDGRWAAIEVKLGGQASIDTAARNLRRLAGKVGPEKRTALAGLAVITAGNVSMTRPDGVRVIALGHMAPG